MNSINLTGRLTRDPELRTTTSGLAVTDVRMAVQRRRARNGDARGAVFVDVTAFGALAESVGEYLEQGRRVAVSGRLELSEWQAEDGSKRQRHYVVADEIEFLERPRTDVAGS